MKISQLNKELPQNWAFVFVLVVGTVIAWVTVSIGGKIIESSKGDPAFNIEIRTEKNLQDSGEKNNPVQDVKKKK